MKILYISYNGALEPLFYSQGLAYLKRISADSLDFELLTFELNKNLKDKSRLKMLQEDLQKSHIHWHRLTYHKNPVIISTCFDIFCGFFYAASIILKNKIKLVHARSYVPGLIAYLLCYLLRVDYIFDMRGMMVDEYVDGGLIKKNGLVYKLGKILERQILKKSKCTVVLTHRIKEVILSSKEFSAKAEKLHVVPCCTDTNMFSRLKNRERPPCLKHLEGKFLFIYTGSLGTWYNLDGMLDFFKIAKENNRDSHFVILSPGNRHYIRERIAQKGMGADDFTVSEADYGELPDFLVHCDAGLIFYKQSFSRLACSPVKLSEYLACGLPVIISSGVGDAERIIRKERIGSVVDEFNDRCYRAALDELLEIKRNTPDLKEACCGVAKEYFSLEKGVTLYQGLYDKLSRKV